MKLSDRAIFLVCTALVFYTVYDLITTHKVNDLGSGLLLTATVIAYLAAALNLLRELVVTAREDAKAREEEK